MHGQPVGVNLLPSTPPCKMCGMFPLPVGPDFCEWEVGVCVCVGLSVCIHAYERESQERTHSGRKSTLSVLISKSVE